MTPAASPRPVLADVQFHIPAWDEVETTAHAGQLNAIATYVERAYGLGLPREEMAEDIAKKYPFLGKIDVEWVVNTANQLTIWVDIEALV